MASTLSDFGRTSERYGDIAFYYAFPVKLWFQQSMLVPEDVLTWCRENCTGFYKVTAYTHEDSVRIGKNEYDTKIMYVDKIYLSSEDDAVIIKMMFEVKDHQVKRPKLKRVPRSKRTAIRGDDPAAIEEATRNHAASQHHVVT
jgi:hypothetical protein